MRKGEGLFTQDGVGGLQGRRWAFAVIQEGEGLSQVVLSVGEGVGGVSVQRVIFDSEK